MSIHAPHIHTYTTKHMSIIYMTTHVQYTNTYTTCITKNIHDHTCTTYTYMHHQTHEHHQTHVHHQIPPKYKIYPVGLPSVLYETPGPNERSMLNQLFLVLFYENRNTFHKNHNGFSYMSFWVITKYRSLVRKTNERRGSQIRVEANYSWAVFL